jgi:hypothetical protein
MRDAKRRCAVNLLPPTHQKPIRLPEAVFGRVKVRRSDYAERIKTGGLTLQVGRGRPRGGAETGPTVLKSVRLPPAIWKELEKRARAEGVAVHALVRKAILALLRSAA